ncbi:MAG: hypothetical protein EBV23_11810 [Flavobacteriia bacterium]|nr:hypothetical protein [Flavobacteriia bacterium]
MIEFFDLFYTSGIATVSEIYYVPYYNYHGDLCNHAYITIHNWHDTDAAYNFIKKITANPGESEARIIYDNVDELWFPVVVAPLRRLPHGYSIINYLIHQQDEDEDDYSFTTLDLAKLPILDKQLDLLTYDYATHNTLYTN